MSVTLVGDWAKAATPPPAFSVSEWADAHRVLPETSAARGARWRTATTPYLRGIMDAVLDPDVRTIAVMKAHQIGCSEALNNIVGYCMQHDPAPMLFVHPTAQVAEAYSKERLSDMIRSTPALREIVTDKRVLAADGRPESTLSLKMFPGGYLALGGANTPNTFARWSVRLAIGDDVDRFPPVVGDEGDPADLLVNRTTSFHDRLAIFVSTPTLKGGRIDTLYSRSDRRRYVVTCPACRHDDFITWNGTIAFDDRDLPEIRAVHFRVAFDDGDPSTAQIECPACNARLGEPERLAMIAAGRWRATAVPTDPGLVGFHVPAMLSPWVTLPELVEKFLSARARGRESLRVFVNTELAEGWEDRGARMNPHPLFARREDYGEGIEVPVSAVCLTAGVDVQIDRFDVLVLGWGANAERWGIDWRAIPGDPRRPETRAALAEFLFGRRYAHAAGVSLPILATCIDSGYATDEIYAFVLEHQHRRVYAAKGVAGRAGEPMVGKPSDKRYGRVPRPVRLYPINVDDAKGEIIGSLQLPVPGPGSFHFPARVETFDEEFFAQLCAEHRDVRYSRGGVATHTVWVQDRERNEALDAAVLALAAFRLLNPNLRDMAGRIWEAAGGPAKAPTGPIESPPETPARPAAPRPRFARSTYLQS